MQFSSIWPIDRALSGATTPGQSGPGSNGNEWGAPHSPKLKHDWNPTIRLFSVISRTFVGGGSYSSEEVQSVCSTALADCGKRIQWQAKCKLVGNNVNCMFSRVFFLSPGVICLYFRVSEIFSHHLSRALSREYAIFINVSPLCLFQMYFVNVHWKNNCFL